MNTRGRLVPVRHARVDSDCDWLTGIPELDAESFAAHDHRKAVAGVRVPRHRLAGLEDESTNHKIVSLRDDLCVHLVLAHFRAAQRPSSAAAAAPVSPEGPETDTAAAVFCCSGRFGRQTRARVRPRCRYHTPGSRRYRTRFL